MDRGVEGNTVFA